MRKYKDKKCGKCGETFTPKAPAQKFCVTCGEEERKARQREGQMRYRKRKGDPNVGVGKGGSNLKGKEHPQYKNGIGYFFRERQKMKEEISYCERCNKDLKEAEHYEWAVHHKDHNRDNNVRENFELLCKRCHQIEHDCIEALEGATTS